MELYGGTVTVGELVVGDWFALMHRKYDDHPDLEAVGGPVKVLAIEGDNVRGQFQWRGKWYAQAYSMREKCRRCKP